MESFQTLLDARKLELGQLKTKRNSANTRGTVDKAVETLKPEAEQSNVELIENSKDITVSHDPERITQVITNLIRNSLTAVEPNTGKIEVNAEDLHSEIKIGVKYNGMGIAKEKQKDLFKRFYQADAALTRERGGSVLGLAICKGTVDNHMGKITVDSNTGQGATFSFTIPKDQKPGSPIGTA